MKKRLLTAMLFSMLLPVSAMAAQTANFNILWQDNSGNNPAVADQEDGFTVERALGQNGAFSVVGQVAQNVTSFTDVIQNDAGGVTYCYRVQAFNQAGKSPYSGVACATTPKINVAPGAPANVTVNVTVTIN